MLDQLRRRWADVVQMLCKYFVFAGNLLLFDVLSMYSMPRIYPHFHIFLRELKLQKLKYS